MQDNQQKVTGSLDIEEGTTSTSPKDMSMELHILSSPKSVGETSMEDMENITLTTITREREKKDLTIINPSIINQSSIIQVIMEVMVGLLPLQLKDPSGRDDNIPRIRQDVIEILKHVDKEDQFKRQNQQSTPNGVQFDDVLIRNSLLILI
jgi:hypothetical protein